MDEYLYVNFFNKRKKQYFNISISLFNQVQF